MEKSFKKLCKECSLNTRKGIKELISNYFYLEPDFEIFDDLYDNYKFNILLKKNINEILEYTLNLKKEIHC